MPSLKLGRRNVSTRRRRAASLVDSAHNRRDFAHYCGSAGGHGRGRRIWRAGGLFQREAGRATLLFLGNAAANFRPSDALREKCAENALREAGKKTSGWTKRNASSAGTSFWVAENARARDATGASSPLSETCNTDNWRRPRGLERRSRRAKTQ